MPSFKDLKVRHLKVDGSETNPVDTITGVTTVTLDKHDSGETILVYNSGATALSIYLPRAKTGRNVRFLVKSSAVDASVNLVATPFLVISASITFNVKLASGDTMNGLLPCLDSPATTSCNAAIAPTANVLLLGSGTAVLGGAPQVCVGTMVEYVCFTAGVWTVTGLALVNNVTA
jgi:hypothetical protein